MLPLLILLFLEIISILLYQILLISLDGRGLTLVNTPPLFPTIVHRDQSFGWWWCKVLCSTLHFIKVIDNTWRECKQQSSQSSTLVCWTAFHSLRTLVQPTNVRIWKLDNVINEILQTSSTAFLTSLCAFLVTSPLCLKCSLLKNKTNCQAPQLALQKAGSNFKKKLLAAQFFPVLSRNSYEIFVVFFRTLPTPQRSGRWKKIQGNKTVGLQ